MANVKVVPKQTNKQTNRQTNKQTGQKQYAPQTYNVTTQNVQPCEIKMYTNYQMSISIGSKGMAKTLYLTFDLEV